MKVVVDIEQDTCYFNPDGTIDRAGLFVAEWYKNLEEIRTSFGMIAEEGFKDGRRTYIKILPKEFEIDSMEHFHKFLSEISYMWTLSAEDVGYFKVYIDNCPW